MTLIAIIDLIVVAGLVALALTRGFERALPFFVFVIVLAPAECVIPLPGILSLTTQRVALITLAVLYLFAGKSNNHAASSRVLPLKYLMLLSLGWVVISVANSTVPVTSLKVALSQVVEYYMLYAIFMRTISSTQTIHRILFAIVLALFVCCFLGIGELYFSWDISNWFPYISTRFGGRVLGEASERGLRIRATFAHPILYGAALTIGIPLALYLLSISKSKFQRILLGGAVLLMFYNIYKTESRGPWLALILSFLLMFLLCPGKPRRYILMISLLCGLSLIVRPGVWQTLQNTYSATQDINMPEGASYQYRYALLHVCQQALATDFTRALWGYGPESFFYLNLRGEFLGRSDWPFLSCDSTWIGFMIETGYVGFLIMATLLLKPALLAFKRYRNLERPANQLSAVLLINLLAFYFMMTNVAMYSWGQTGYLLWIVIAMSLAYGGSMQANSSDEVPEPCLAPTRVLALSHPK